LGNKNTRLHRQFMPNSSLDALMRWSVPDPGGDPTELTSIHARASPALIANLKARLDALQTCAGAGCKTAENGG